MRALCPAKVNLFLAVGPRDSVGYHPIRSIFQAVGLFDELEVVIAEADSFECSDRAVQENNTITKALRLLREFGGVPPLRIRLDKRIPSMAGLGGGSSDAAGFLRIVNRFSEAPFSSEIIFDVAFAVGADVPFFLVGGLAKGEGYGEKLTPLPDPEPRWLTVVKPDHAECSTPDAYRRLDETPYPFLNFPTDLETHHNDFERVMPRESEDWQEHLQLLGASRVLLCGSGSAVFGFFASETDARSAEVHIKGLEGAQAWAVPTLSRAQSLQTFVEETS